jgi:endogenous inhibitor of DNA gyrase (YacG/DUF329 family)
MVTTVRCPTCKKTVQWLESNASRPFCDIRCKTVDLGAWASDAYVVEGAAPSTQEEFEAFERAASEALPNPPKQ